MYLLHSHQAKYGLQFPTLIFILQQFQIADNELLIA